MFYIVAGEICWEGGLDDESRLDKGELEKRMEDGETVEKIGTLRLIDRYHSGTKVDESWWANNDRRGCFDCTKAERMLGWRHEP